MLFTKSLYVKSEMSYYIKLVIVVTINAIFKHS